MLLRQFLLKLDKARLVQKVPGMKLPEIDLEELERLKEKNFRDRMAFQD